MKRLHPPIHLLRAFVATARQSSVSRAADELHLTQSAVSKQVLELESLLGVGLFLRVRSRLVLSPAGQRYLSGVSQALGLLETATLDLLSHEGRGGVLNLSTLPTFGAKWLIPRLPAFQQAHPEVTLNFIPFSQGYDFALPQLDCAIRFGEGVWPGAVADYLTGRQIALIAAPKPRAAQRLRKPADILGHTLLQYATDPTAWVRWCEAHGVDHPNPLAGPKLDQVSAVIRASMAGLGIGLAPLCLVRDDLDNGFVASPLGTYIGTKGYHLCYPEAKAQVPSVLAFRNWLVAQARNKG